MTQERHCLVFPHESCFLGVFSPTPPTVPAPYIHTETHTHTLNWISNGAKCFRLTNKYFQMQIPSLPPGPPHNCSLSSWRQSRGGGAAKINPIFCSFSVLGCNPLLPPRPLHRWGISWASGSALSRGEGDGQGRD